jgi:hypothetical protein
MHHSRFRLAVVLLAVVGMVAVGTAVATAVTDWQTFGTSWAVNRGAGTGSPSVDLSSVTLKDPVDLRYTIKNHAKTARDVDVTWQLECWIKDATGMNEEVTKKSGGFTATIAAGATIIRKPSYNAVATWCELDVKAEFALVNEGDGGRLTMKFQAKY